MEKGKMMTRKDVAEYLNVSVRTVDRIRKRGALAGVRVGGVRRFAFAEVDRLVSISPNGGMKGNDN